MPIAEILVAGSRLSVLREGGLWTSGTVEPRLQKVVSRGDTFDVVALGPARLVSGLLAVWPTRAIGDRRLCTPRRSSG